MWKKLNNNSIYLVYLMDNWWLVREEMPDEFDREQKFSAQLTEQLNGLSFTRGSYHPLGVTERYIINAEHSKGDKRRPDITLRHDMPTDDSTELSNPYFIQCKLGDAYRSCNNKLTSFRDTGIKEIQTEISQLFLYRYRDTSVSFSENICENDPNKYRQTMPEGRHKVLFTCPFLLTRPSNWIQDQCECCEYSPNQHLIEIREQFCKTIWDLGFGVFFRENNGKLIFKTSYHDNYQLLVSRTDSA